MRKTIGLVSSILLLAIVAAAFYILRIGDDITGGRPTGLRLERTQRSPNFVDGAFVNLQPTGTFHGSYWSKATDYFLDGADRRPDTLLPVGPYRPPGDTSGDYAIWLGHATVLLRLDSLHIITDPVFDSHLPLLVGSTERFQPCPVTRAELPAVDVVIISHDHYDHLEKSSIKFFAKHDTRFVVPLGVGAHLETWGVSLEKIIELDWWQATTIMGVTFTCTPARHLSGRSLFQMNRTLWASFALTTKSRRVFYSGDTGYSSHFAAIGDSLGPFDLTLLQVGAYDNAWPDIHLMPEDVWQAHRDLRGTHCLPVHWGTYDVALHPWQEPVERLLAARPADLAEPVIPLMGDIVWLDSLPDSPIPWWRIAPN